MNPYQQYMYSYPHKTAYRPLSGVSLKEYAPLFAGKGMGCIFISHFARKNAATAIYFQ